MLASQTNTDAPAPRLVLRKVSKTFGPIKALSGVDLTLRPGTVHALMGENGAGKSTLIKVLSGAIQPDSGAEILIDGQSVAIRGPKSARDLGIAVIYQELSLSPNLTVAENMFLGRERRRGAILVDGRAQSRAAAPILSRLGADFTPHSRVSDLSMGQRQLVEIARALLSEARILVMDEPTTSLSEGESARLFGLIERLRAEGMAIVYVSHRMEEVYRLADEVTVLRDGTLVGSLTRENIEPGRLVSMMVGRELSGFYRRAHRHGVTGEPRLSVRNLTDAKGLGPIDLDLYPGEILGVSGLVGAGRTELARLIFGADRPAGGEILLEGQPFAPRHPHDALTAGVAYLTEDRKGLGLFLSMSVAENVAISVLHRRAGPFGWMRPGLLPDMGRRTIAALDIRGAVPATRIGNLSGGNQQKGLLARLLETQPRVLILDEPTRGVDIGAKAEIYALMDRLTAEGVAIILISSELAEILGTADRILVMRNGRVAGALSNSPDAPATQEDVMRLSAGAHQGVPLHDEPKAAQMALQGEPAR